MSLCKPKKLTVKKPLRCAMRDNTFYESHGVARRYHIVTEEGFSACGRVAVMDDDAYGLDEIEDFQRCQSPGCRRHWPKQEQP